MAVSTKTTRRAEDRILAQPMEGSQLLVDLIQGWCWASSTVIRRPGSATSKRRTKSSASWLTCWTSVRFVENSIKWKRSVQNLQCSKIEDGNGVSPEQSVSKDSLLPHPLLPVDIRITTSPLTLKSHLAKGRVAAQQDESDDTTAPQVLSSWGESLGDDLRGKIGGGPTNWRHCWELVLVLRETKVSHQQRLQKESLLRNATFEEDYFYRSSAIVVIEKVFRFEVSMHNSTGVEVSHSRKNLLRPNTVFFLSQLSFLWK